MDNLYTILKNAVRGKGLTMDKAATILGFTSREGLYNHIVRSKLDVESFTRNVKEKLSIDLTNPYGATLPVGQSDALIKGNDKFIDFYRNLPLKQKQLLNWIPFYDVDFAAGITKLYRDGLEIPTFFAALPMFPDAKVAIKVRGDSMEDPNPDISIPNGSYAALKGDIVPSFNKDFKGGHVYGLVFKNDDYIIKKVRSTSTKNVIRTESHNKSYEPKDYSLSDVRHMYPYLGYIRMKRQF